MPGYELIDEEEKHAVSSIFDEGGVLFAHGFDVIRSSYHVREFETACSSYFCSPYALALSSGTSSIKCALKALNVGPGDEVITQGFNFVATVEAIVDCGAVPVICAVDKNLHIDVMSCLEKVSSRTKAIIVVHMLGMPGPINDLIAALEANSLQLPVIEDACESVGAKIGDKYTGTLTDLGVFSFDHGKNLTCGEGGMVLTSNAQHAQFIRSYSDHGHQLKEGIPRGIDQAAMPGFNYRMTEMQAAVGKVQLSKLERLCSLHEERYQVLEGILHPHFHVRQKSSECDKPSFDTFMITSLEKTLIPKMLEVISAHGFTTKNIPDAMFWHCAHFWEHIFESQPSPECASSYDLLSSSLALPVLATRSLDNYEDLANALVALVL